jgi:hypothetical protein
MSQNSSALGMRKAVSPQGLGLVTGEVDDNLDRYIWVALAPAFIGQRNRGATFLGDFPGEVLPAKIPIRIASTRSLTAFELRAGQINDMASAYNATLPDVDQHPSSQISSNSAKKLANFYARELENFGVAVLSELAGAEAEFVNEVFGKIFRKGWIERLEKEGKLTRVVENVVFEGVFLDQIRDYLRTEAGSVLTAPGISDKLKELLSKTINELRTAVDRAWAFANEKLNETEKLIRKRQAGQPGGKEWYDSPDHRFPNALPPLDLVCLAQTDRVPIDLKELEASKEMSETLGKAVIDGIAAASASDGRSALTMDAVKAMLDERDKKHSDELKALEAKLKAN